MLKRSQSGTRARLLRSSSSRSHQWKTRSLAILGVLLFLCTVAFLQAKPKFSAAPGHASRNTVDSHDHPSFERFSDFEHGGNQVRADEDLGQTALETSNLGEDSSWASDLDVETSFVRVSKQLDKEEATNDTFASGLEDDEYLESDAGNLQEDRDAEVELETEELENLENPLVEGFDDVDDYEQSEKDELEEQIDLRRRKSDFGVEHKEEIDETENTVATKTVNTRETGKDGTTNSSGDFGIGINRRFYRRFGTEKNNSDSDQRAVDDAKSSQRSEGMKTVPKVATEEHLASNNKAAVSSARRSLAQTYGNKANRDKNGIIWDHLLGVVRRTHNLKEAKTLSADRKSKIGAVEENKLLSLGEKQGFFNMSSASSTQIFTSDDEPLEQDFGGRLEGVTAIEDALLLRTDKGSLRSGLLYSWINNFGKKINKARDNKNQQSSKVSFDPLNPDNNPLLQDPDTVGNGLTSGDNALRKALLRTSIIETPPKLMKAGSRLSRRN